MKYRKTTLVEAELMTQEILDEMDLYWDLISRKYLIETKQGRQYINPGDYLITNPDGEKYPCNPETFLETYEAVVES